MSVEKYISPYIANQLPRLYREEGPVFISFLKAYFEFMEQQGEVINESRNLLEYRDIDDTLPEFITYFRNKYMSGVPENLAGDSRTLQKHIKEIYGSKGTIRGLELVFRLLANENIEVYYPGNDILKPSDGVWVKPTYLEVSTNSLNVLLVGEQITGRESGATAIVEDFQTRYINRRKINVLYLSNLRGDFKTGEILLNDIITDPLRAPTVVGSMSDIEINESGFDYKVGDVLEVVGGSGVLGKAVVSNTSARSGAVEFTIINGGSGYANDNPFAPTTVTVEAIDANNPGIGATFSVGRLGDTEVITTAVDEIEPYIDTPLSAADYGFQGGFPAVNINTPLDQALNIQDITVGTILTLRAINPGEGYNGPVRVTVVNDVIAGLNIVDEGDGTIKGQNAEIKGDASSGRGAIDSVKIMDSGLGYQDGDVVELVNANNEFISGGTVRLGKQGVGEGYWKDTRSFLNSDKYIQDSFYFQEYSFEVRVALAFQSYADIIKRLWQPAGTESFGRFLVASEIDSNSQIEEVSIDAIFITEYTTSFSTFVGTTRATNTLYDTMIATTYPTTIQTLTQRATNTTLLQTIPDRIVNGTFDINTANWSAFGDSVITWESGALRVERAVLGRAYQSFLTTAGKTYYVQASYTNSTNTTSTQLHLSTSEFDFDIFDTESRSGAANSFVFSFVAPSAVTYILLDAGSGTGQSTDWDNISVKELPEQSRATQYDTNIATTTVFDTSLLTNRATTSVFNTNRLTDVVTQRATLSFFATNRATQRTTASIYVTTFDTSVGTNRATATSRNTTIQTNRSTTTAFETSFDTLYDTNRATNTLGETSYSTNRTTSAITSSVYNTTYLTTALTDTAYATTAGTSRSTDTTRTTTFDTAYTTSYVTAFNTSTAFVTNRITAFSTTYDTIYNSSKVTTFLTNRATATTKSTNRATATTKSTNRATATTKSTNRATTTVFNTSTLINTNTIYLTTTLRLTQVVTGPAQSKIYNVETEYQVSTTRSTTTSLNTATSRSTTTTFNTTGSTTTTFNTTYNTTTAFVTTYNTTTQYQTSRNTSLPVISSTTIETSRATAYDTNRATATSRATSAETTRATSILTAYATTTAYVTTFNTAVATNTLRETSRSTQVATATTGQTTFDTTVATTVVTSTAFQTFNNTTAATNRTTTTTFGTIAVTTFDTTTAFITTFATNRSTQIATSTAYNTTFDTNTLRVTDVLTQRTTVFATNRGTTTSFSTTYNTNRATDSVYVTENITTYVEVPTTFQTFYNTDTTGTTDYDTGFGTERVTATDYDTDYATSRLTSINTATDLTF